MTDIPHIFVVSGGKGLAGDYLVKSLLVQFPDFKIPATIVPDILTEEDARQAVLFARKLNGVVVHTMVDKLMRRTIDELCRQYDVPSFDLMGNLSDYLSSTLGVEPINRPGLYRIINQEYFDRVSAIEFTLATDDGMNPRKIHEADIILTGISRTGKTPLSIYLAMFGWKVTNVPLVFGIDPPEELFNIERNRVFGLTISINTLIAQRQKRVSRMGLETIDNYLDIKSVSREIEYANRIFARGGFQTIDVTNKPIETSANEILGFLHQSFDVDHRKKSLA